MTYTWDFGVVLQHSDLLLAGLGGTMKVTVSALAFGIPIGLALALARLSRRRWVSIPSGVLIEFLRSTPPLAQLFWVFFALPILTGVKIDPFEASVITFALQSSAFFAEAFRAGIISIERGQWEAARALGMRYDQTMRRIVLPQAVKRMIPVFLERVIELMKTTTLVSTVSYSDLLFNASELAQQTFRPLEVYTVAAFLYFVVIFTASNVVQRLERRLALSGESTVH
jgi:polar amino acid transport system permease protein